jgi:YHS domain-containing protein
VKDMAIDPVCKMEVDEETTKYISEYKGKKYYFCTLDCKEEFDKLGKSKDPACGMEVDEKTAKYVSEYNGKKYYFDLRGCKETFDENPAKYVK